MERAPTEPLTPSSEPCGICFSVQPDSPEGPGGPGGPGLPGGPGMPTEFEPAEKHSKDIYQRL